ncbi:gas vesicle structural protein GvpA [bacterium]|nr:gas vesicle structural protein GvpA [bacterium]
MPVERASGGSSLIDVLDRVLDKGIVIDAWVRVSLVGIDLITVEARVVVASIDTYLKYSEAVSQVAQVSRPPTEIAPGAAPRNFLEENKALRAELKSKTDRLASRGNGRDDQDGKTRHRARKRRK